MIVSVRLQQSAHHRELYYNKKPQKRIKYTQSSICGRLVIYLTQPKQFLDAALELQSRPIKINPFDKLFLDAQSTQRTGEQRHDPFCYGFFFCLNLTGTRRYILSVFNQSIYIISINDKKKYKSPLFSHVYGSWIFAF